MYVLSQKGDITINVKSTVGFKVEQNDFGKGWEIRTIFPNSGYRIAVYDTEERAKEVLREILEYYDWIEKNEIRSIASNCMFLTEKTYFEIPKE